MLDLGKATRLDRMIPKAPMIGASSKEQWLEDVRGAQSQIHRCMIMFHKQIALWRYTYIPYSDTPTWWMPQLRSYFLVLRLLHTELLQGCKHARCLSGESWCQGCQTQNGFVWEWDLFIFIYDYLYPSVYWITMTIWLFDGEYEDFTVQSGMFDFSIPSSERSAAKQGYVSV